MHRVLRRLWERRLHQPNSSSSHGRGESEIRVRTLPRREARPAVRFIAIEEDGKTTSGCLFRAETTPSVVALRLANTQSGERVRTLVPGDESTPREPSRIRTPLSANPLEAAPSAAPALARRLRAALHLPLDRLLPGPESVLEWPGPLMAYQLEGVQALMTRSRVLLADDMGLGKTIQAIVAVRILCIQRAIDRVLLVVPASLIDQWRREFARWAPELRVVPIRGNATERSWLWKASSHVALVSYETLRSDTAGGAASYPSRVQWDLVILDEAQKIKNRDAEISRSVKDLPRRRSWAMTGTPLENALEDLASIMEFVDHKDDGSKTTYVVGPGLLTRHRELQLRRRKLDVLLQLPPKRIVKLNIPLLPRQQEAYRRALEQGLVRLRARGNDIQIQHVLELITRLKQLCNVDPVSGESSKLVDIRDRMQVLTAEGHRALLFSQYTDASFGVAAAAAYLDEFAPLTYTGANSSADRDAIVHRFKHDSRHRVLILSLRAGGVGLNLQDATYVFHLDRWWNPAVERQAEDRSHRMGQTIPVNVFKYTCSDTIEERIDQILAAKQSLFDDIVDSSAKDEFREVERLTRRSKKGAA